ncbi:hypothetical protein M011DRAFT_243154 [Sporormia fimetaria CBS 119925]|uniref:Camp independent regulatory protein n=1 Tax=Sporormia fimetaria CBS 119925 TaxID=1340428 RepID=A0A6A6VMS6_9PLEO|nr:hypothetical protein M011DRAFT_243154 [Sporormia fimetaria CBS 119925]
MLQSIRASTLTLPSFGHSLSVTGVQKMDGYGDAESWAWSSQQSNGLPPTYPAIFDTSFYNSTAGAYDTMHHRPPITGAPTGNLSPVSQTATPPVQRQQHPHGLTNGMIKAQPAFRPTWFGYLDTTKDAMTVIEAALQGRLSHISRRPHDKERAEMLSSGTVLVYEENASGIKRWTDAVHWSPSRVMNNYLIYRQLVRALRPEEKRTALNPSCGSKRKRKGSGSPAIPNSGDDEYEHSTLEILSNDTPSMDLHGRVYANFAQNLSPEQQRRFCGSLIDSYEFKDGGLMKKTISVKYQGTTHHVISYYTLEDVASGRLKRPFQDPKLADIEPRAELLEGWKVSLEDEESKDMPLFPSYSHGGPRDRAQNPALSSPTAGLLPQGQVHVSANVEAQSEYWAGSHSHQYIPHQPASAVYAGPQHLSAPYAQQGPHEYAVQQTTTSQYQSPEPSSQHYPQPPPRSQYSSQPSVTSYPSQPALSPPYGAPVKGPMAQYQSPPPNSQYPSTVSTAQYPEQSHTPVAEQAQYSLPQLQTFDMPAHASQAHTPPHSAAPRMPPQLPQPPRTQEPLRRASAPVALHSYSSLQPEPQYPHDPSPQQYYNPHKYASDQKPQPGGYY